MTPTPAIPVGAPSPTSVGTRSPRPTQMVRPTPAASLVPPGSPSSDQAASTDWSLLEPLYPALRPENGRTSNDRPTFTAGETVELTYDLVDHSAEPVVTPYLDFYGSSFYLTGTEQTWIERLGPDPTIGCMTSAGRKGTWYASGGSIIASLEPVTVAPGKSYSRVTDLYSIDTGCFESGRYRYHIEYKPLEGDESDVIAETVIELTFVTPDPSPTPSPSVR